MDELDGVTGPGTLDEEKSYWDTDLEDEEESIVEDVGEVTRQAAIFLDPEWYGLEGGLTDEILTVPSICPVPCMPGFVKGLINLRGDIVVVFDIKEFFGLEKIRIKKSSRIVIVKVSGKTAGILVDGVSDILDIPVKDIQPPLATVQRARAEYVKGETRLADGRFLVLIDMQKVMVSEQVAAICRK